jgi:hypothetical protein
LTDLDDYHVRMLVELGLNAQARSLLQAPAREDLKFVDSWYPHLFQGSFGDVLKNEHLVQEPQPCIVPLVVHPTSQRPR